ncbi:MAG: GEVED domain-containing protein, partial [Bacteroidota bacterium]
MKKSLHFVQAILFVLFFYNSVNAQYCTPVSASGCAGGYGITSFQFGDLNQSPILCDGSPSEYYHDFTSQSADFAQTGIYDISVQAVSFGVNIYVWIDYNGDSIFDNATELATQFFCPAFSTTSTSITIPVDAAIGATRLRVLSSTNSFSVDPCFIAGHGNCSDFSVNIISSLTPPTVSTFSATDITAFAAVLHGSINANNSPTHSRFNYGTGGSYTDGASGDPWFITGGTTTDVTTTISGLTPNTIYHYELVGYGPGGSVSGGDMEFTTGTISPTVTTDAATGISGVSAMLNGTVNANNLPSTVTFEYGLDDTYGNTVLGNPSSVTGFSNDPVAAFLTGLALNTTYHYRVISTNDAGTSYGADMTFTTLTTQYCIPVYTNGCAGESSFGLTHFELNTISESIPCSGSPSYYHDYTATTTDLCRNGYYSIQVQSGHNNMGVTVFIDYNQNNDFDGYSETVGFGYCTNSGSTYTINFTVPDVASAGATRLRFMTGYYEYPLNPCSTNQNYGNCADFTVNLIDPVAAPTVTTLAVTYVTATDAVINGTVNANDILTNVEFHYGTTVSFGNTIIGIPATVTGTTTTDVSASLTGLIPNTTYYFMAAGFGEGGYISGDTLTFTTATMPPTVTTDVAYPISGTSATL